MKRREKVPVEDRIGILLNPRSIAFIGASDRSALVRGMFARLTTDGFEGPLFMVNPRRSEVFGLPCHASLDALPQVPDLVIIALNAAIVSETLKRADELGVRAAIVISTGFADAGPAGHFHVERLREVIAEIDMAVCGPGSFGFMRPGVHISPFAGSGGGRTPGGRVGVVAQSGGFANVLTMAAPQRGFGFSAVIASGSELGFTLSDYLRYLVHDEATDVVVAMLEDIRDVPGFALAMREAARRNKPIIVLALGRSEAGQRATSAHSGALAGRSDIQRAFLEKGGAIVVDTLDDLLELVILLGAWRGPLPAEPKPLFTTVSGGDCSLILDLASDLGIDVPEIAPQTQAIVRDMLPESTMILNPIDFGTRPLIEPDLAPRITAAAAADRSINMILTRLSGDHRDFVRLAGACAAIGKPHASFTRAALQIDSNFIEASVATGVPLLQGVDRALAAVQRATRSAARRQQAIHAPSVAEKLDADAANRLSRRCSEREALAILAAAGVPTVKSVLAAHAGEAVAAAEVMAAPVVLKIESADIEHKSDIGGVRLNLVGANAIASAYAEILINVQHARPDAAIGGVVVQPMLRPDLELIFGAICEPRFGPAILLGFGGLLAEMLGRRQILIPPVGMDEAAAALGRLISGGRAKHGATRDLDLPAAASALVAFSRFAEVAAPYVEAIEINPIGIFCNGGGAIALDALILPRKGERP